jgi:phosphatidylglycerophosphate synthase
MTDSQRRSASDGAETAFLLGLCETKIWGSTGSDRAERLLRQMGIEDVVIAGEPAETDGTILYLRADCVVDQAVMETLRGYANAILVAETESGFAAIAARASGAKSQQVGVFLQEDTVVLRDLSFAGFRIVRADEFGDDYNSDLRKRSAPIAALLTDDNVPRLEWASFEASYKGVTDVVTKYAWPRVAFPITQLLSRVGATPNQVTFAGLLLSIATFVLFWNGMFIAGLLSAWLMALLDTVDGKLARVTLTSSRWGNVFDHGIDLIAPPLWWLAWWFGLGDSTSPWIVWSVWIVLGGHLAGKLIEQAFISTFGLKVHMWQRFDSTFRLIAARRNPNLIILTIAALAGFPVAGYLVLAAWIIISFDVHTVRYMQAFVLRKNGTAIGSWLAT